MLATRSAFPPPLEMMVRACVCRLLEEGFASWNKRDLTAFTRAAEKYGRHALTEIARDVDGKTEEEVGSPLQPLSHALADLIHRSY